MAGPNCIEWHFQPPFCGTSLGLRTVWDTWKWSCQLACKGRNCSPGCWNRIGLGGSQGRIYSKRLSAVLITSTWQCVIPALRDRLENWSRGLVLQIRLGLMSFNPLKPELNPICYLLALLAHHFLHVSRIRVKSLTFRWLMLYIYIYGAPILDVSRSHTTTQHSR